MIKLPKDWVLNINKPSWIFNLFGYYYSKEKRIEINPPIWIPRLFWLRKLFINLISNHEITHSWGIIGCKKPWCLMFEAEMFKAKWKDVWWEKVISFPFQLLNGFRSCKFHRHELINILKIKEQTNGKKCDAYSRTLQWCI